MKDKQVQPVRDDEGVETHPAWGMIGASRVSSTGHALFDSDVLHQHYVIVRIQRAERKRNLMRDWLFGSHRERIIEIAMSEAQWASFVSTMNVGDGVACTIERVNGESMPEIQHEPRLAESMDEVAGTASKSMEEINTAFAAYKDHKTAANLRTLEARIRNAPSNMTFAASSLSEHAENVVQRARADIEAMVNAKAKQLGIDPGEIANTRLLGEAAPDQDKEQ